MIEGRLLWSKLIGPLGEARLDLSGFLEANMASLKNIQEQ
jgi:hypothetical protein